MLIIGEVDITDLVKKAVTGCVTDHLKKLEKEIADSVTKEVKAELTK